MNKIIILVGLLLGSLTVHAQTTSELWDGNLTEQQVISKLHRCELLPLFFNDFGAFESASQKAFVAKIAIEQAERCKSYAGYFNAAVIYFARPIRTDGDRVISLNWRDAAHAGYFASLALEINPNSVQMLFLRGMVYVEQGAVWNVLTNEYTIRNREEVLYALEDFEKIARLNPSKAPFVEMSLLNKALKKQERIIRRYQQGIKREAFKRQLQRELSRGKKFGERPSAVKRPGQNPSFPSGRNPRR